MTTRNRIAVGIAIVLLVVYGLFDPERHAFPKCPFFSLTGWLCPGCGSQRAIHHVLHGHFAASFSYNPLFLPVVGYALAGVLIRIGLPQHWPFMRQTWFGLKAAWGWLILIVIFWLGRNLL